MNDARHPAGRRDRRRGRAGSGHPDRHRRGRHHRQLHRQPCRPGTPVPRRRPHPTGAPDHPAAGRPRRPPDRHFQPIPTGTVTPAPVAPPTSWYAGASSPTPSPPPSPSPPERRPVAPPDERQRRRGRAGPGHPDRHRRGRQVHRQLHVNGLPAHGTLYLDAARTQPVTRYPAAPAPRP